MVSIRNCRTSGIWVFTLIAAILASSAAVIPASTGDMDPGTQAIVAPSVAVDPTFDIPVQLGWNFISVPLVQWNTSVLAVLDDNGGDTVWDRAIWFDPLDIADHTKQYYTAWAPGLNDLNNINHTIGFELNVTNVGSDGMLRVNGTLPSATNIVLYTGWNMVGYPTIHDSTFTVGDLKASASITHVQNRTSVNYSNSYVMKRGEGYWVNASSNDTWTLPNAATGPAPTISLISPQNKTLITRGTVIRLNVTGDSPSVNYTVNGVTKGNMTLPYNISTQNWLPGNNTLKVSAVDANGTASVIYLFTINSTRPNISLIAPANNSVIKPGVIIRLNVTGDKTIVKLSLNAGVAANLSVPYNISSATWLEGTNIANVTASDANGTKTSIFTFIVDSINPTISLVSPANNTLVRAGRILDFNIQDAHFASANYSRNGTAIALNAPFDLDTSGWPDGLARVTIRALDQAGNDAVKVFAFNIDATSPRVVSVTPANASTGIAINAQVVITFSERMNRTVTESSISIRPAVPINNFTWNADWTQLTIKFAANMTQGTNYRLSIGIIARDLPGNTLTSVYTTGFTTWLDTDGDGLPNERDLDDDGDGVMDPIDAFPLDPDETLDTDKDGIGDNTDLDDDGDGVPDAQDAFPLEKFESLDSDGDGVGDNQDLFPNDPTETTDADGDGVGDNKDFMPSFDNNLFYSLLVLAPCITAVLITLIVTRARRPREPRNNLKTGDSKDEGGAKPEKEDVKESGSADANSPKKREPADPMTPPPED